MKTWITLVLVTILVAVSASAGTLDNDATCDIKVGPAATLLVPYFEVDLAATGEQTSLFTITNVSRYSQIAHVTLWTDWAFPVLTFNIFLAGYDVQGINLKDILVRGIVASPVGTGPTTVQSPLGALTSRGNGGPGYANPNFNSVIDCDAIPGVLPPTLMAAVRSALTTGVYNPGALAACPNSVGGTHANAIGYATIDVVGSCTTRLPSDPLYYTTDLLYDNVLIGDYQQIGPQPAGTSAGSFDAGGNPMVHVRAVPEGGGAGSNVATELPYTFYDRYTPAANRTQDRRQPLPSTFAARFIQGGPGAFATNYTIWREGFGKGACGASLASNQQLPAVDIVRFDEHDNPSVVAPCNILCPAPTPPSFPATSSSATFSALYPTIFFSADVGGWMYLNLNNGGSTGYSVTTHNVIGDVPTIITGAGSTSALAPRNSLTIGPRPSQNWVTITMFGNLGSKRLVAEFDAASLGNGCSPAALITPVNGGSGVIGPAGGVFVCPPGTSLSNGTTALCTATNINPRP
ncbi:MAG TPA: hypothetical protein VGQ21_05545 [Thermoanaerobaculia bacterium]|jgi:hypothetical protein|nr:hypothetical protein [Thermoanaerobaculia bacterium]